MLAFSGTSWDAQCSQWHNHSWTLGRGSRARTVGWEQRVGGTERETKGRLAVVFPGKTQVLYLIKPACSAAGAVIPAECRPALQHCWVPALNPRLCLSGPPPPRVSLTFLTWGSSHSMCVRTQRSPTGVKGLKTFRAEANGGDCSHPHLIYMRSELKQGNPAALSKPS